MYGSGKRGKVRKILVSAKDREFCEIVLKVKEFYSKHYKNYSLMSERNLNCAADPESVRAFPNFVREKSWNFLGAIV